MYLYLLFKIKIIENNITRYILIYRIYQRIIIFIVRRSNKLVYYFHNFNSDLSYYVYYVNADCCISLQTPAFCGHATVGGVSRTRDKRRHSVNNVM